MLRRNQIKFPHLLDSTNNSVTIIWNEKDTHAYEYENDDYLRSIAKGGHSFNIRRRLILTHTAKYKDRLTFKKVNVNPVILESSLVLDINELLSEDYESYYVCFGFKGKEISEKNHVTLMYFGKIDESTVFDIQYVIDNYIEKNQPKQFQVSFVVEDWFGELKDVRVLRPLDDTPFLLDLREELSSFNGSKFKDFKPHFTTKEHDKFHAVIDRIQLSKSGYEEVKTWYL